MRHLNLAVSLVTLTLVIACSNGSSEKSETPPKSAAQSGKSDPAKNQSSGSGNATATPSPTPVATTSSKPGGFVPTPTVAPTTQPTPNSGGTLVTPTTHSGFQLVFDGGGAGCEKWNVQVALDNQAGSLIFSTKNGFDSGGSATVRSDGKLLTISGETRGRIANVSAAAPKGATLRIISSLSMSCNNNDSNPDATNTSSLIITPGIVRSLILHHGISLKLTGN